MVTESIGRKNLELALARKTEVAIDGGVATSGGATTLNDTAKSWTVNQWSTGFYVQIIKPATGAEYFSLISANTATQLTFAALAGGAVVVAGDLYSIKQISALDLTALARLVRWGRNVDPAWTHAAEVVAPLAGAVLVTQAVGAGVSGYIYGFFISCGEANDFLLNWTSGGNPYSKRIVFGGAGVIQAVEGVPMNEGLPADATTDITITNVNAGGVGMVYQANLLYAEV